MNITINYPGGAEVVGAQTVHAMQDGMTECSRRPVSFTVTDKDVTCPICLKALGREQLVEPPKLGKPRKKKPIDPAARRAKRSYQHRQQFSLDDPEVAQQAKATRGLSRSWYITDKGRAALATWEEQEKANE